MIIFTKVKRCVAAYHVTCAVKEGLEMKTVMMQEKDDVQHIVSPGNYFSHGGTILPNNLERELVVSWEGEMNLVNIFIHVFLHILQDSVPP